MTTFCRMPAAGIVLALGLAACDWQSASASAASEQQAYDIVTQTRPESAEGYYGIYRGAHQVCAATREALQLPPAPPLVELPADFVTERISYLGSGGAYLTRHEEYAIELAEPAAPAGCSSRISSTLTEVLVRDGKIQTARRYADGAREVDTPEPLAPARLGAADQYSERKQLGGHALRCAPAQRPLANVMPEMCVPDAGARVPLDGQGQPIVVYARNALMEQGGVVLLTEPVRVELGTPVSPSRLALSKGE